MWILIVAAVVLEGIACFQYFYSRSAIRKEAERRAKTELCRAELEIEMHTIEMETVAKTLAMMAEKYVDMPDSIFASTRSMVAAVNSTSSLAVAYVPGYFPSQGTYFEACSSRISDDSIHTRRIGSATHDYTQMEWYKNGLEKDSCWWTEPYLDDSGSQTWVVSCSYPVRKNGKVVAVVCVDLSLDYLQKLSEYLQIYQGSYYSIRSSKGVDIVASPDTVAGRDYEIFHEEIDATGWNISIIIPDDVIYAELKRVSLILSGLMLLGLALLLFILFRSTKNIAKIVDLSNQQERIESELNIARNIQMAMLPTRFPPFENNPNLTGYGVVVPAKEIGGDLFDFLIRDNKLFFCIGDVSGKGVPAALVMAVTRSLFRSFTKNIDSPAQIVSQMNGSLSEEPDNQNMFVTLFIGVLDLNSGNLRYCNAGHNAPVQITNSQSKTANGQYAMVDCIANIPLGILAGFDYREQAMQMAVGDSLFLYTDGLTEAENEQHELFGEQRMLQTIRQWDTQISAAESIAAMQEAVSDFVGDAIQSDDLTMFTFRFLSPPPTSHHSLVMRNDIEQIPTLAEWVDSLELPQDMNMTINLAIEEAVSNVMLYAYPENESGQVLVEADKSPDMVVFTITDSGKPFDPTAQAQPDISLSVEERPIGGLGIHLVRQIMDEIKYERKDNNNILTLIKKIQKYPNDNDLINQ